MRCIPDDPGALVPRSPSPDPPRQRSSCSKPPGFEVHGLVRVQRERDGSEAAAGVVDGEDARPARAEIDVDAGGRVPVIEPDQSGTDVERVVAGSADDLHPLLIERFT